LKRVQAESLAHSLICGTPCSGDCLSLAVELNPTEGAAIAGPICFSRIPCPLQRWPRQGSGYARRQEVLRGNV